MKNLKKLVSVVLTLALLISTMATGVFAVDYADVETTDANFEAIDILSGLNILKGDELGNFNPDAEIKRSEVAAVIARALGQENAALGTTGYSSFADVSADHWAVGYINWAAQQGIVNGRDAATFDPDAPVKYQEVTKMLVEALGYGPLAAKRGGYPTGHMVIASSNAITAGVSLAGDANAPRKIVAQLVYNALDVPLMDASIITASGDDEYAIYNGKGDNELRTILTYYLEIAKVKAQVVATSKGYIAGGSEIKLDREDEEEVMIKITDLVGIDSEGDDEGDYYEGDYDAGEKVTALSGGTDADDMLGYNVIAYVGKDADDEDRIFAITPDTKKSEILEIKDWYDAIDTGSTPYVVEYYVDGDTSEDAEEIDVKANADVIVNGANAGKLNDLNVVGIADADALLSAASTVTFMGDKNADVYDYVFVTLYEYAMVSEANVEDENIEVTEGDAILLDDEDLRYTISLDGEEIALGDLQENDILNMVWQKYEDRMGSAYVDIYVTRDTVEGSVTEYDPDEAAYTIAGVSYKTWNGDDSLALGDEGTFYLTIDGKIYDMIVTSASKDYAFITRLDSDAEFGTTTYYVEMLTADGTLADYTVAASLKVSEYVAGEKVTTTYKRSNGEQAAIFAAGGDIYEAVQPKAAKADAEASIEKRFIAYTLNSNSELASITFAKDGVDTKASVFDMRDLSGSYKPATERLDSFTYTDATKLFVAPATVIASGVDAGKYEINEDSVEIGSFSALDEDVTYEGYAFNVNADKVASAIVLKTDITASGIKDALAVVTGRLSGTNNAGEEADGYSLLKGGETITVFEGDDTSITLGNAQALAKGDIIYYTVDGAGDLKKVTKVYDASANALVKMNDGDYGFAFGKVEDVKSAYITITNDTDVDGDADLAEYVYANEDGLTYAVIDTAKASTKSYVTALSGKSAVKKSGTRDTYVAVIRVNEDDEALDVIEIKTATDDFSAPSYKIDAAADVLDAAGDESIMA